MAKKQIPATSDPDSDAIKTFVSKQIARIIKREKLTSAQAAKRMQINRVSLANLTGGRLSDFTLEALLLFVTKLGYNVTIALRPSAKKIGRILVRGPEWTTAELLTGVKPGKRHGEFDIGPPVGKEIW